MNLMGPANFPEQIMVGSGYTNPTLTQQLENRKKDLEDRLKEITDALGALKKNPELENMLNLIAKVRY